MTATKQTELLSCRNCGGQCDPKGWMCGDGRQGPECEGCGITTPDVESWNRLMAQSAPEPVQGEADDFGADVPICWVVPDFGFMFPTLHAAARYLKNIGDKREPIPLYTAAAKPGADQLPAYRRKEGVMGCKRFMNQKCYDAQSPEMKARYEPFNCANCLAVKPDAEPRELSSDELLLLFERHGIKIEVGEPYSVRGQIAQLLNAAGEILRLSSATRLP